MGGNRGLLANEAVDKAVDKNKTRNKLNPLLKSN